MSADIQTLDNLAGISVTCAERIEYFILISQIYYKKKKLMLLSSGPSHQVERVKPGPKYARRNKESSASAETILRI